MNSQNAALDAGSDLSSPLLPIYSDGMWGYADITGRVVIDPQFESTGKCLSGIPYAIIGDDMRLLSPTGKVEHIVPNAWSQESFYAGLLVFERNGLSGACDTCGNIVIDPRYAFAGSTTMTGATVCEYNKREIWFRVDRKGIPFETNQYGLIRPFIDEAPFTGARLLGSKEHVVIDQNGVPISEQRYADIRCYRDGLIPVKPVDSNSGYLWLDSDFKEVVKGKFQGLGDYFSCNLIPASQNGRWGLARPDGTWAVAPKYEFVGNGGDGFWPVAISGTFVGDFGEPVHSAMSLIDRYGNLLTPQTFSTVLTYGGRIAQFFMPQPQGWMEGDIVPFGYINSDGDIVWQCH